MTILSFNNSGPVSSGFMAEVCPSLSGKNGVSWCLKVLGPRGGGGEIFGFNKTDSVRVNVTLKRFYVTFVAVEKQLVFYILSVRL